jgi:hypothetical protein
MEITVLLATVAVALAGGALGYALARRYPHFARPLVALGFLLLAANLLPNIWTAHFYWLQPPSLLAESLLASAFVLPGALAAGFGDSSSRRVLNALLAVLLAYFCMGGPLYFALYADEIRAWNAGVKDGVTIQTNVHACVPASLATVLRRWGLEYTDGQVAYRVRTTNMGTAVPRVPGGVADLGQIRQLQARIANVTLEQLAKFNVPAVLLTYKGPAQHARALIGMREGKIVIGEPLRG